MSILGIRQTIPSAVLDGGAEIEKLKKKLEDIQGEMNMLNENEIKVLEALIPSSSGNGHDFGFTDELEETGFTRHQNAGFISQLVQKNYIDATDLSDDPGVECNAVQFNFTRKAEDLLNSRGHDIYVDSNH